MNDIDIAVAEKVMGLTRTGDCPLSGSCRGQWGNSCLRPYSTNAQLAIEDVAAKIINEFPNTCELHIHGLFPGSGDSPHWEAAFEGLWDNEPPAAHGVGDSPAEAICNAALEFVNRREQRVIK